MVKASKTSKDAGDFVSQCSRCRKHRVRSVPFRTSASKHLKVLGVLSHHYVTICNGGAVPCDAIKGIVARKTEAPHDVLTYVW